MCGEKKFFICKHCGNVIGMIEDKGVPVKCCGENMTLLEANTVDASQEKHVPVASLRDGFIHVKVGSMPHPMEEAHHISWVYLETKHGGQRKCLPLNKAAEVDFALKDDEPIAVYAYCNLHGLWKTVAFVG